MALRRRASTWGPVAALVRQLPVASPGLTLVWALALSVTTVLPLSFALASGALVGGVTPTVRAGLGSAAGHRLILALVATASIFALQQAAPPVLDSLANMLGRRLTGSLRRRVMTAALRPPGIAHLEDPATLDLVSQAQGVGTAQFTPTQATAALSGMVASRLGGAAAAGLLATYRWWLAGLVLVVDLTIVQVQTWELRRSLAGLVLETETFRRAGYIRDLALTPPAAKEIRVFGLERWLVHRFGEEWTAAMKTVLASRDRRRWAIFLAIAAAGATDFLAYSLIGYAAVAHQITIGHLTVLIGAVQGSAILMQVNSNWLNMTYGAAAVPAVLELERTTAAMTMSGDRAADGLPHRSIRFDGVGFSYPGSSLPIYSELNLEIEAGRSLAIVGRNGAGKTTLVKLLARLYDPTSGRITVDDVPLTDLEPRSWQPRVAAIFQDFTRFALPVSDNVSFADVGQSPDVAALDRAAARAGAEAVVAELPHGWSSTLSRQFTDGTELSGGQWQRVALARAMAAVEAGAGVLILDEPTANLDVRAEAELYDRFLDLTRGLTTVLISHRFSTVRRADRIVVLEDGRVIEDGDHDSLMATGGRYAEMFRLQAARFEPAGTEAPAAGALEP
ncbi:MAG TPA: ABC transporter ATP-binding protein [Acidimicrobiales bacterium]|nr:ABC transporter ATP-binding protein [Acidimicrobiales bacterium]